MRVTIARVWRACGYILLPVVVLTFAPLATRAQPATTCSTPEVGFEDLRQGTTYEVGGAFRSGPAEFSVRPVTSDGQTPENGFVSVDPEQSMAGGTGLELLVLDVLLAIDFGDPLERLDLRFGAYGGSINLEVNGDQRNVDDVIELSGSSLGGVPLTVVSDPATGIGRMTLEGTISTFAIGGGEFWIDEITADPMCPDLAIGDVSSRFEGQGQRLNVTAVVENRGEAVSPATDVTLAVEGWGSSREPIVLLEPGDSTEIALTLPVPPGEQGRTVSFVITVDPVIGETDPTNNVKTIDVLVPAPDDVPAPAPDMVLRIAAIDVQEELVVIDVVAQNRGGSTSRPTTVVAAAEGWPAEGAEVEQLAPGDDADVSLRLRIRPDQRGKSVRFVVTIDPDDVVRPELDESNNRVEARAEIQEESTAAVEETSGTDGVSLWLLVVAAASVFLILRAVLKRLMRKRPSTPDPSLLDLELRVGEPDLRVASRPDGSPRHTVRLTLRPDRAREDTRERTPR